MARSLQSRTISEETYCRKLNVVTENIVWFSDIEIQLFIFSLFRYCEAFPSIKSAIQRVKREQNRVKEMNNNKESSKLSSKSDLESKTELDVASASSTGMPFTNFTLQRRLSTATDVKYDMYLMNLGTMLNLFGSSSDRKKNFHLCHQDLLEQGRLTRFEDLPLESFVIFVSHQWNSFNHPDPSGHQTQVFSKVMRYLRDGRYKTETDPFQVRTHQ